MFFAITFLILIPRKPLKKHTIEAKQANRMVLERFPDDKYEESYEHFSIASNNFLDGF